MFEFMEFVTQSKYKREARASLLSVSHILNTECYSFGKVIIGKSFLDHSLQEPMYSLGISILA